MPDDQKKRSNATQANIGPAARLIADQCEIVIGLLFRYIRHGIPLPPLNEEHPTSTIVWAHNILQCKVWEPQVFPVRYYEERQLLSAAMKPIRKLSEFSREIFTDEMRCMDENYQIVAAFRVAYFFDGLCSFAERVAARYAS